MLSAAERQRRRRRRQTLTQCRPLSPSGTVATALHPPLITKYNASPSAPSSNNRCPSAQMPRRMGVHMRHERRRYAICSYGSPTFQRYTVDHTSELTEVLLLLHLLQKLVLSKPLMRFPSENSENHFAFGGIGRDLHTGQHFVLFPFGQYQTHHFAVATRRAQIVQTGRRYA